MILNGNSFQIMLYSTIKNDIASSMNPQIQAKESAIQTIERYIQSIPFVQSSFPYYGANVFGNRQAVKDHFCSFWKRELGLSYTEIANLEDIFEYSVTRVSQFANNTSYLVFENENSSISIHSMEDAIFDALDLKR